MSDHEKAGREDEQRAEEHAEVEDLEVPREDSDDVKGGGKVNVQDISFTKKVDKSSPGLF